MNIQNIKDQIIQKEKELETLKSKFKEWNELKDEQKLADLIHSKTCHGNHIDWCGYHYEKWDEHLVSSSTKMKYLNKAKKILTRCDYQTAEFIISNI